MNKKREDSEDIKKTIQKKSKDLFGLVKGKNIGIDYKFKIGDKTITLCVNGSGAVRSEGHIFSENTIKNKSESDGITPSIGKDKVLKEITTTIIGRFTSYVKVGDKVKEEQKIGNIIASGLPDHHIISEYNGKIKEVCLENGKFAEYKCVLFRIKEGVGEEETESLDKIIVSKKEKTVKSPEEEKSNNKEPDKILVANRGDAAVRAIRACKELGIDIVTIYSEVDKDCLHTRMADESYCIGPDSTEQSYLNIPNILSVAVEIDGIKAIHPGWGFLAENPDFAKLCKDSGLIFIGPSSKAIQERIYNGDCSKKCVFTCQLRLEKLRVDGKRVFHDKDCRFR